MPFSTKFHFYYGNKLLVEETEVPIVNQLLTKVTDKLYHIKLYPVHLTRRDNQTDKLYHIKLYPVHLTRRDNQTDKLYHIKLYPVHLTTCVNQTLKEI